VHTQEGGLRFTCAIDLPHDEDGGQGSATLRLAWLGGDAHVLAIARAATVHLVSLASLAAPRVSQSSAGPAAAPPQLLATVSCNATVLAFAAPASAAALFVTLASGAVACLQPVAASNAAWSTAWSMSMAAPHVHAACSTAEPLLCASAGESERCVTLWLSAATGALPARQTLALPAPVLCLEFSAKPRNAQSEQPVLLVAARDGAIRLYADAAAHGAGDSGAAYCLVHLLSPPSELLRVAGSLLRASWALPCEDAAVDTASVLWLAALVYNPAVAASQHGSCAPLSCASDVWCWHAYGVPTQRGRS